MLESLFMHYILQKRIIYKINAWLDPETRSGPGANLAQTAIIRTELPKLLQQYGITSLLDIPCGDYYWMAKTDLSFLMYYIGADIVPELIAQAIANHQTEWRKLICVDMVSDTLPYADAILCRDCLPHMTYAEIKASLKNFKATGARYLITSTYPTRTYNVDLSITDELNLWRYRPLNLELAPFNFPKPLFILNEGNTESNGGLHDKSLAIWFINDIPDYQ
jgi:hypothetical protein